MKKNLLFLICLLFSFFVSSQNAIQGKVVYTISMNPISNKSVDSILKKQKTPKHVKPYVRKMLQNSKDVMGVLLFSNAESLYQVDDKMKNEGTVMSLTYLAAGAKSKYYSNSKEKNYFKQIEVGELLRIEMPVLEWSIAQETKMIGNYQCFKAVARQKVRDDKPMRMVEAWFTPIIPVNFGPKEYFGLPGLILEISYDQLFIKATRIILNPKEEIKIEKPNKGKRMTEKEYKEMSKKFFKNLERGRR